MRKKTKGWRWFHAILSVLGGVVLLSSCAQIIQEARSTQEPVPREKEAQPRLFVSEDFIIYRLKGSEKPDTLAERFLGDSRKSWIIEEANRGALFEKNQLIVVPLKEKNRGGLYVDGYQTVPVLCYHRFADQCGASLCTPTGVFEQQMRYLKENGYTAISMAELLEFLSYRRSLPEKAVVITLDDGYSSIYEIAYPVLKKLGFTATLFIYTDFVGASTSSITWDQLKRMKADGFEVGSHSLSHCDLTKKREGETEQSYLARVKRELLLSKQIIDQKLDQNTAYMAFPYGEYNQRLLAMCEETGYKLGFSVRQGGNPFFSDPLALRRDQILKKDMESFVTRLRTFNELPLK